MIFIIIAICVMGGYTLLITNRNAKATLANENFYAMNNIFFYEPGCTTYSGSYNGAEISADDLPSNTNERLKLVVETYGELAMELQIEYGLPWEMVFAQMVMESSVGTTSDPAAVSTRVWNADKKYNWLGMKCGRKKDLFASGCYNNKWSEYDNVSSMIAAWAISYGRNGYYDKAFSFLDPNNYSLEGFAYAFINIYAPKGDKNNPKAYTSVVMQRINEIDEIAKEKGWPTSEELAKTKNIQVGGNWPVNGDIRDEVKEKYGDTMGLPTGSSVSNSEFSCYNTDSENFLFYNQGDERWGKLNYGPSGINGTDSGYGNIKQSGCGPSSFAMMATALLGREILPNETADIAGKAGMHIRNGGSSWEITKVLAEHYGLEYEDISGRDNMIETISQYLKDGWMIHTSGKGSTPFTSNGHFIGIRGITDDGKWLIADSNGQRGRSNTLEKEWDPEAILAAGMDINDVCAIKGGNRENVSCDTTCDDALVAVGGDAMKPIGELCEDSDTIACAEGTNFIKVVNDAHCGGKQIKINLCEVPNILQGGKGIKVNSRVSGAYYALGERMKSLGWNMAANSSFRSYAQQKASYAAWQRGVGNMAAKPGRSNHEAGLAVDLALTKDGKRVLNKSSSCPSSSIWPNVGSDSRWFGAQSKLLCENLADFGLAREISSEYWHVSPTGK